MIRLNNHPKILAIKSDTRELNKVKEFLFRIFEEQNFPKQNFNKVFLCVSEAVVNSIEHGNKYNGNKEVAIQINYLNESIDIVISDDGDGFDFTMLENPTSGKNLKKENGRGIFIMKSLSNQVIFRDQGKCVQIKMDLK